MRKTLLGGLTAKKNARLTQWSPGLEIMGNPHLMDIQGLWSIMNPFAVNMYVYIYTYIHTWHSHICTSLHICTPNTPFHTNRWKRTTFPRHRKTPDFQCKVCRFKAAEFRWILRHKGTVIFAECVYIDVLKKNSYAWIMNDVFTQVPLSIYMVW